MQWNPHVTVAAVVERDSQFLLVQEDIAGRYVYNQPAGHLERDETLLDAVRREVWEETGRRFTADYLLGVYLYSPEGGADTYLRFCFSGECGERDPAAKLDTGIIQTVWMSQAQLQEQVGDLRTPLVTQCIDDYLSGKRYPLDLLRLPCGHRVA
ncbi:MAG: NUDIX hydrolase [Gammaproteobacteria bacterium]